MTRASLARRTTNAWRRHVVTLLAVLLVPAALALSATAQEAYRALALQDPRPRLYHEAMAWPAGDAGVGLLVAFRIPHTQLVFQRAGDAFEAEAAVAVRVLEGEHEVERRVWRDTVRVPTFEATQDRLRDVAGTVLLTLPPGRYRYRVEGEGRTRATGEGAVTLDRFEAPSVGTALLLGRASVAADGVEVEPVALGGDVSFADRATALVPLRLPADGAPERAVLRWRLVREARETPERAEQEVASGALPGTRFVALPPPGGVERVGARLAWAPPDEPAGHAALVDLRAERLTDGAYRLVAALEANGDTVRAATRFDTHWRAQPLALYDVDVAIDVLRFVEERDRLRGLGRGPRAERVERLRAYWAGRDPTPATPYNELMAEYYGRVDHAARAFRTGVVPGPDGLTTDRARIYVVHGPPDDVTRRLPDRGGVEEVWYYADGSRFVFRAATSYDAYRLVE